MVNYEWFRFEVQVFLPKKLEPRFEANVFFKEKTLVEANVFLKKKL
jgi:hypothetical protein